MSETTRARRAFQILDAAMAEGPPQSIMVGAAGTVLLAIALAGIKRELRRIAESVETIALGGGGIVTKDGAP